jgi:hypothetical protein
MFHSLSSFFLAALLLLATSSVVSAADAPKFDVEKSCRASFSADAGGADKQSVSSCVSDEKAAGDTISKDWASYPGRDREHCQQLATLGGTPSYVEMLTCLQIARDTKTLPADIRKSGIPKQ